MASGKRMFRVAVSYTVAVAAETDSQALSGVPFIAPYDPTVRKLSMTVLSSWMDKPKDLPAPIVEVPDVTNDVPGQPMLRVTDKEIPF